MIRHYFLTAWRNLARNKAFSAINIFGLALGLACSLLLFLWALDERSMDSFHTNQKDLYTVYERVFEEGNVQAGPWTPGLLARELKRKIPEIKYATGYFQRDGEEAVLSVGLKDLSLAGAYADSDFFKMFSYPLLEGTPATALSRPDDIALSRNTAESLFGTTSAAYGKAVRVNQGREFRVAAIYEDLTPQSSRQFAFLLNYPTILTNVSWLNEWIYRSPHTYIQLQPNANPARVEAKIKNFITPYLRDDGKGYHLELGLQPYAAMYLNSNYKNGYPEGGRIEYVRLFTLVAVFILLIACINFMNLATARAVKRAKEVGIRKAVGALRLPLITQFLGEAMLLTFFAVATALLLVLLLLPAFNNLTEKHIVLPWRTPAFWLDIVSLWMVTGFVAGSYPALFLSSLRPVKVLKGILKFSPNAVFFRKGLVIFQFVLSIVLITGTIVIAQQIRYVRNKNLGYDKDNLVYIPFQGDLVGKYETFKQELSRLPGIAAVTRSTNAPSHIGTHFYDLDWEGKDPAARVVGIHNGIGYDYLDMMKIPVLEGRGFSRNYPTDSSTVLINETAAKLIGYKDPIGKWITFFQQRKTIIGVVKDFHLRSLHDPIQPLVLYLAENTDWGNTLVKIEPGRTPQALAGMEKLFKQLEPGFPFRYYFSDEQYQRLYASEQTVSRISDLFSFLAITISCLGLLGLTMFTVEQRRKEIGVRKVIGARVTDIVALLSTDIIRLVLAAALVATPLAWFLMDKWLQGFAYRITINAWIFLAAALAALFIALLTISYQAVRAALANPVNSLRSE